MADREHDLVLFGATGFTGGLTAEYLARNAPEGTRWALAGRNLDKLARVQEKLGVDVPLLKADTTDPASMRTLAESTRVVLTTVGPYMHFGEPVVAACAAAGTDYGDLTGEPEFRHLMWMRHHDLARETGARIVHCCGFDSIPADLGTLFTVQRLPEGVPLRVRVVVSSNGPISGGTYHSAVNIMAGLRRSAKLAKERRRREGMPAGRAVHNDLGGVHRDEEGGGWVVPLPTIDPEVVLSSARELERYGPDFTYTHSLNAGSLPKTAALAGGAGAMAGLAQAAPTRKLLLKLKAQGEGPSAERRARSWFRFRVTGEGGGERLVCEVSGGDPGYEETAKMLAESGLCLAHDDLPERSGQLTTAVAMGDSLIDRLTRAGIRFEVTGAADHAPEAHPVSA